MGDFALARQKSRDNGTTYDSAAKAGDRNSTGICLVPERRYVPHHPQAAGLSHPTVREDTTAIKMSRKDQARA